MSDSLRPDGPQPHSSSIRGILQARILEWIAIPFSRGYSWPRDQTWVFHIAGRFFTVSVTKVSHKCNDGVLGKRRGPREISPETQRGDRSCKDRCRDGQDTSKARDAWEPAEPGRGRKRCFLRLFGGTRSCWHLDIRLLASRLWDNNSFLLLSAILFAAQELTLPPASILYCGALGL